MTHIPKFSNTALMLNFDSKWLSIPIGLSLFLLALLTGFDGKPMALAATFWTLFSLFLVLSLHSSLMAKNGKGAIRRYGWIIALLLTTTMVMRGIGQISASSAAQYFLLLFICISGVFHTGYRVGEIYKGYPENLKVISRLEYWQVIIGVIFVFMVVIATQLYGPLIGDAFINSLFVR